jgi:hypothetical protein
VVSVLNLPHSVLLKLVVVSVSSPLLVGLDNLLVVLLELLREVVLLGQGPHLHLEHSPLQEVLDKHKDHLLVRRPHLPLDKLLVDLVNNLLLVDLVNNLLLVDSVNNLLLVDLVNNLLLVDLVNNLLLVDLANNPLLVDLANNPLLVHSVNNQNRLARQPHHLVAEEEALEQLQLLVQQTLLEEARKEEVPVPASFSRRWKLRP